MAWNQSMNHAMHLSNALKEMVHLVTYTSCRMSNNNCSPQTQGPYAPLLLHFLFLSGNKGLISGGFNGILFKCIKVNIRKKKSSTVKDLTIPLKQKRVWMFLAYVGEGAYKWDAIAEFLLILVVMSLQHGIPHLLPQTLVQLLRCHHVCLIPCSGNRERHSFCLYWDIRVYLSAKRYLLSPQWCLLSCPAWLCHWECSSVTQTGCAGKVWRRRAYSSALLHPLHPPRTSNHLHQEDLRLTKYKTSILTLPGGQTFRLSIVYEKKYTFVVRKSQGNITHNIIETRWFKVIVKWLQKSSYKMSGIMLQADATRFDNLSSNAMTFRHFTMCPNTFWGPCIERRRPMVEITGHKTFI